MIVAILLVKGKGIKPKKEETTMKEIKGICKYCGKEFSYDDCQDISGMIGDGQIYDCCRECAEEKTIDHPDAV